MFLRYVCIGTCFFSLRCLSVILYFQGKATTRMAASFFLRNDYLPAIDCQGHPAGFQHACVECHRGACFLLISFISCTQTYSAPQTRRTEARSPYSVLSPDLVLLPKHSPQCLELCRVTTSPRGMGSGSADAASASLRFVRTALALPPQISHADGPETDRHNPYRSNPESPRQQRR